MTINFQETNTMAYRIAPSCEACNNCRGICPVSDAIIAGEVYRIDEDSCISCGICVESCPTSSIYEPRVMAQEKTLPDRGQTYARNPGDCAPESLSL
jgi:ferredoxin